MTVNTQFISNMLKKAIELNASDIHLAEGKRPVMRIDGKLTEMTDLEVWGKVEVAAFLTVLQLDKAFKDQNSLNSSFTLQGKRFRFHGYRTFSGVAIALRVIPLDIPKFETLNLPDSIRTLVKRKSGLVLVTGPTGSGKSTTLASLIDLINNDPEDRKLVITIEEPVEFIYKEVNARIIQREVGKNVDNYEEAVKDAMREDPDVILIGELKDREAIRNAITLADTGHLVLASLHSNGAGETIDRILDAFPGDQQGQVKLQLINSIQGIIHQRLIPRLGKEGGRVPLVEVFLADKEIRRLLLNKKDGSLANEISRLLQDKHGMGMVDFVRSAAMLVKKNFIDIDTAVNVTGESRENITRILNTLR